MREYQKEYIDSVREIAALSRVCPTDAPDFETWYEGRVRANARVSELKKKNVKLLNDNLFPFLDGLYGAKQEDIDELVAFSDALMDQKTNLDCGTYVLIHESLLSFYRTTKQRENVIRELYKLGMGMYYLRRHSDGIEDRLVSEMSFQNELLFTEAASYLKYFDDFEDEETKGYVVRSLGNIAITGVDVHRKIAASSKVLKVIRDESYRKSAPGLPWDSFLINTHRQMSSNRTSLTLGTLSKEELSEVLDSCYEVFKPEDGTNDPSIRWLWPYYDMEYCCGYVDLATTAHRLEELVSRTPFDRYDGTGLYGNVQLAIYYGKLMRKNPSLCEDAKNADFLAKAYEKMVRCMLTFPKENYDEYFGYMQRLVLSDFFETEGVVTYKEVITSLTGLLPASDYVKSRKIGEVSRILALSAFDTDEKYFDDIPFIEVVTDKREKREKIASFASEAGFYCDFGLNKMNMTLALKNRNLFENEQKIYELHTVSGYQDLGARRSTAAFADIAHGHHAYYSGKGGYPETYKRSESVYRMMTDVVSVAVFLVEENDGGRDGIKPALEDKGERFSPFVSSLLYGQDVVRKTEQILLREEKTFYKEIFDKM